MHCVIVLAGTILDDKPVIDLLQKADLVISADGGIRHLRRFGRRPDYLVGDLDSVDDDDMAWVGKMKIPVKLYPADKNETDAELALQLASEHLPEPVGQHEIILAGALGDRPDHVLSTQLLAVRLAERGWRFRLTDGCSTLYTLHGPQILSLDLPSYDDQKLAVSAIPISASIAGLSYQGLSFPLVNANLPFGSTRGISNHVVKSPVIIELLEGSMLIIVTPE